MIYVFLGPPGSGKGTQAKLLAEKLKIPQIVVGDLLREEAKGETEMARRIKEALNLGRLAPEDITVALLRKRISQQDCKGGFILDGFPRSLTQAKALAEMLKTQNCILDKVIYLFVPENIMVKRLTQRRNCRRCGAIFHLENYPPKEAGKCDFCKGELYQRDDDQEGVIRTRLAVYEKETFPLVERYQREGKLVKLEAQGEIAEVFAKLVSALNLDGDKY